MSIKKNMWHTIKQEIRKNISKHRSAVTYEFFLVVTESLDDRT